MEKLVELKAAAAAKFPSPFGVHVLKSQPADEKASGKAQVSVPFRGSCSEICVSGESFGYDTQ